MFDKIWLTGSIFKLNENLPAMGETMCNNVMSKNFHQNGFLESSSLIWHLHIIEKKNSVFYFLWFLIQFVCIYYVRVEKSRPNLMFIQRPLKVWNETSIFTRYKYLIRSACNSSEQTVYILSFREIISEKEKEKTSLIKAITFQVGNSVMDYLSRDSDNFNNLVKNHSQLWLHSTAVW